MAQIESELIALRIISSFALGAVAETKDNPSQWLQDTRERAVFVVDKFAINITGDEEAVRDQAKQIIADMFDNIKIG